MKNLSTSAQHKRKPPHQSHESTQPGQNQEPNRRSVQRRTGGECLDHAGAAGFVVAEDLFRGVRGVGRRPGAPAVHRARGAWAMAAARVPAQGRAAARRAGGRRSRGAGASGRGGNGERRSWRKGRSGFIFCSRRISWAFRKGFGPGLFENCAGARYSVQPPPPPSSSFCVQLSITSSTPGPLWTGGFPLVSTGVVFVLENYRRHINLVVKHWKWYYLS